MPRSDAPTAPKTTALEQLNVSEARRHEITAKQLALVVDAAELAIWRYDPVQDILSGDARAGEFFGLLNPAGPAELWIGPRWAVARGVNLLRVYTNYELGRCIVEQEQRGAKRAGNGKQLLVELADRLTEDLPAAFRNSNLEHMRRFYLAYPV